MGGAIGAMGGTPPANSNTSRILPKVTVFNKAGLNNEPNGKKRDLDGSQLWVPKIDFLRIPQEFDYSLFHK